MTAAVILLLSGYLFYVLLKPPEQQVESWKTISHTSEFPYKSGSMMQLATSSTQLKYVQHERMAEQIRSYEGEIR